MKKKYRLCILFFLVLDVLAILWTGYDYLERKIPDEIFVSERTDWNLKDAVNCPWIQFEDAIEVAEKGSYSISCKILGIIPYKKVKVLPAEKKEVFASGSTIGIYMEADGVLIIDTEEILSYTGELRRPAENIVKSGDYIVAVDDKQICDKEELVEGLKKASGEKIILSVKRNGEIIPVSILPVKDMDGFYKLGIWVRDDTQGIGTLTYVDEQGNYGALGHGISDMDTGEIMEINSGYLYQTKILGILKGLKGSPGELSGVIHYEESNKIGSVEKNTENGIYGKFWSGYGEEIYLKKYPVAYKQEIHPGEAKILSCINNSVQEYKAEILKIDMNHKDTNKSFVIQIDDTRLLQETGGIVQGMSGSPIIQDGKIIGAVTHVFVNDPTKGYGIFIEEMLGE